MTVAVYQPGPKEDSFTKIAKGLAVAQSILGIKNSIDENALNKQKFEAAQAEKQAADTRKKWEEGGGISPEKYADLQSKGVLTHPTPGMPVVRVKNPDGTEQTFGVAKAPKDMTADNDKKDEKLKSARERAQNGLNRQLEEFDTQIASADEVMQIAEIAKTNPAAAGAIGLKMARAAGEKGVLSDADKRDYGGSQALQDKISRYLQRAQSGTLTPEDANFAASFAQTMREASLKRKQELMERNVRQFTRNYGGKFEDNYDIITGMEYEPPKKEQVAGQNQTTTPPPSGEKPKDKFQVGKTYTIRSGVQGIYRGDGKWDEVKTGSINAGL